MNEHTWEKLDADMRSEMAQEHKQERCPHEDLYVNEIMVKIRSRRTRPTYSTKTNDLIRSIEAFENWEKYLAKHGTEMFEMYAEVVCEKCGATQEQHIDIDEILQNWTWEWEE